MVYLELTNSELRGSTLLASVLKELPLWEIALHVSCFLALWSHVEVMGNSSWC